MLQRVTVAAVCRLGNHSIPLWVNNQAGIGHASAAAGALCQLPGCPHVLLHGRHLSRRQISQVRLPVDIRRAPVDGPVL